MIYNKIYDKIIHGKKSSIYIYILASLHFVFDF